MFFFFIKTRSRSRHHCSDASCGLSSPHVSKCGESECFRCPALCIFSPSDEENRSASRRWNRSGSDGPSAEGMPGFCVNMSCKSPICSQVLYATSNLFGHTFETSIHDIGGAAWDDHKCHFTTSTKCPFLVRPIHLVMCFVLGLRVKLPTLCFLAPLEDRLISKRIRR